MTQSLRILSYNIHKGFNQSNARFLLDEIRHAIRLVDADILFLQEVVGENKKHQEKYSNWQKESQFEFLADEVWHHFAYGKNAIYQHGHHGNAILSKHPFDHWENLDISRWRFSQRGILHGRLLNHIHVYCVHLGLLTTERDFQFKQLLQFIEDTSPADAPLIIAGDFNDWHGKLDKKLQRHLGIMDVHKAHKGKLARTFPALLPLLPMDRIYTRGFDVKDACTLVDENWRGLSDHCALYTELELKTTNKNES